MTRTILYRHFDDAGDLLYVGISLSAITRLAQHRSTAHWSDEIAYVEHERFATREQAEEAEKRAIREEQPLHNVQRYGGSPPPHPDSHLSATEPSEDFILSFHSPERRKLIAEGRLTQLDHAKWRAGGYGPDPFGIASREVTA